MDYDMGVQLADDRLDKRRRKSAIRRKAIKFTKIVSLVGIRHATDARNSSPRRIVWVAWLVFGFGFAIFQIQDRIDHYCHKPTVTEFKIIISDSLLLPQVTVCNDNEIVTSKAKDLGFYEYDKQLKAKMERLEQIRKQGNDSKALRKEEDRMNLFLEEFHNFSKDWRALSKNLTLTAEEAVVAVTFNGKESKSLMEEVETDRGHCFAFSTKNRPLNVTKAGSTGGLFLVLSVARKEYEHISSFEPGYRMLIHDSEEIPRMKEGGIPLKPGVITRVAVSLEDLWQKGPPYGSCYAEDFDYKEENCLIDFEYKSFFNQCGCITFDMKLPGIDGPICSYANYMNCTVVNRDLFLNSTTSEETNNCSRQCHSRIYAPTHTVSAFPMLMNEVSTNVQGDSQILDRIRVYVYYEDLTYTEARNEPEYELLELLSDIGGALSLLLGATLLTVYEGGEFLLLFARDYLHLRLAK